ncbi:hypothetical protein P7D73_22390 [Enterococcus raffinosus]|jgi:hypothetical protein|uniref:hypothetical protein n=1 Tax=Enterococcus raffinosus TaxID=71452 RepID=UPI00288CEBEC|nr:hypothetical protein [Enterococcus raffinosus]MDT2525998.1 hypothetical protein [Enterococcus raffinosus]MDT2557156.1 hypothetical protein [Enterococcus raffinosus]MDT2580446.1 hypothetical protein [Enterococcus raffinosus]MDT2593287.1 hypothetical protein [Enterococcus raffinosus]
MLNKKNIMGIIQDHQDEIDQLEYELEQARQWCMLESVKAQSNRLAYLKDNQCRYKLQAKAWGLIEKV